MKDADRRPQPEQERKAAPSSEWTPEDRQMVVLAITQQMREHSRPSASQTEVATWAQKIYFVLTRPATFLEDNREQILEDLPTVLAK